MRRPPELRTRYEQDLRLIPGAWTASGVALTALAWALAPVVLSDFWVTVLVAAGIAAVGAIGLNLLTGYTGQVSLGHAFFLGAGAYVAANVGGESGWPLWLWLPAAGLVGAVLGAIIGPFALRLRGQYLVVVTLGLVFVGEHLFSQWRSVTGGGSGVRSDPELTIGPVDFGGMDLFGREFERRQMMFWLVWGVVAVGAVAARNLVRSRAGRAMQAVRDRDVAAEVIGVSLFRYKVGAFALSSAYAAVAGGLFLADRRFVSPEVWNLFLSIEYVAIIIIGGLATVFGSIIGAVTLTALPRLIEELGRDRDLPLVSGDQGGSEGVITIFSLNQLLFGLLIVVFLIVEPRGLAAVWLRVKAYFKTWPFSY